MKRFAEHLAGFTIIATLFAGIYFIQYGYDQIRIKHVAAANIPINEQIEPTVPAKDALSKMTMGFNTVVADALWLQSIQYYGGGDPQGKYRQLPKLMEGILTIDPRFTYPYSFAGLVLPQEGYADDALKILAGGEKVMPESWSIYYDEGTIYAIYKKDSVSAAKYYQIAASKPGAPAKTKYYSAVQFDISHDYQTAISIFQDVADNSDNEYFKQRAKLFVAHYQLLDDIETLNTRFYKDQHRYPTNLDELVAKHYADQIPEDPLGRKIIYDSNTGKVSTEFKK